MQSRGGRSGRGRRKRHMQPLVPPPSHTHSVKPPASIPRVGHPQAVRRGPASFATRAKARNDRGNLKQMRVTGGHATNFSQKKKLVIHSKHTSATSPRLSHRRQAQGDESDESNQEDRRRDEEERSLQSLQGLQGLQGREPAGAGFASAIEERRLPERSGHADRDKDALSRNVSLHACVGMSIR
jgi:hypothetical protein